jgi:hypothetical protein
MPLYMMQWNSKDVSFVLAEDREEAACMLDAEGQAQDLVQVPSFKIRLAFDNTGMRIEQATHGADAGFSYRAH